MGGPRDAALLKGEVSRLELGLAAWEVPSCCCGGFPRLIAELRLWGSLFPLIAGVVVAVVGDVAGDAVVVVAEAVAAELTPALELNAGV